ncbi:MAG: S8 family serine peptidase [Pseudomonadota bacterium]
MTEKRKVIIELRHQEAFETAKGAGLGAVTLDLDHAFHPVVVDSGHHQTDGTAHVARGEVHHEEAEALEEHPDVVGVWDDAPIVLFSAELEADTHLPDGVTLPPRPYDNDFRKAEGTLAGAADFIGANEVWAEGVTGKGVTVADVGGGMTAVGRTINQRDLDNPMWPLAQIPQVTGGWPIADWGTTGATYHWHGNVMATGFLGVAPDAEIYDLRIVDDGGPNTMRGMISDALAAFRWAIDSHRATGKPQILNNSWGIVQLASAPVYARDPNHPFTRKVKMAVDSGLIVLFAAGNCGAFGTERGCDPFGPGNSIWGANGAPDVMTVAAANPKGQYIGYGGQGPAALAPHKPDFCGMSHYSGYMPVDFGTSSACATASGAAALLLSACPGASQAQIKQAICETASQIGGGPWNDGSGHGIIQIPAALSRLRQLTRAA